MLLGCQSLKNLFYEIPPCWASCISLGFELNLFLLEQRKCEILNISYKMYEKDMETYVTLGKMDIINLLSDSMSNFDDVGMVFFPVLFKYFDLCFEFQSFQTFCRRVQPS
jgi:hypothetical protein